MLQAWNRLTLQHLRAKFRRQNHLWRAIPPTMPPRTLSSLAHALQTAPSPEHAFGALAESLLEIDRSAVVVLISYDARRTLLDERMTASGADVVRDTLGLTLDHLPAAVRSRVSAGADAAEFGDRSAEFARLLGLPPLDGGMLTIRGLLTDGQLSAVLVLHESKKLFGGRTLDRFRPAVALYELAFLRFAEREAREEAVRTLEDVTQRVHADYLTKLGNLEEQLRTASVAAHPGGSLQPVEDSRLLELSQNVARAEEEARRAARKVSGLETQLGGAIIHLEQAYIELHRRNSELRQASRTLTLLESVIAAATTTHDPRALVDELLSLVGDDMQAQRVSLMLSAPEPDHLYLAAARGIAPHVIEGQRVRVGQGVARKVAAARTPLLVEDVDDASAHPLLRDEYFTTGSFISFPLVYHDKVIGVVNLTNRARKGVFNESDVERVRLLAGVIALVAAEARLAERLLDRIHAE